MNAANQQLAFARVQARAAADARSALARRAHWQAGVFQLNSALEAYASELQQTTKLSLPLHKGQHMFTQLLHDFQTVGVESAELRELAHLEHEPESWLNVLQQWTQNLLELGNERSRPSILAETSFLQPQQETNEQIQNAGMIAVVDADSMAMAPPAFSESLFENAINQAAELLERQRMNSSEW